ncbi:DUF924 family protein [Phaeovulum sp. NW3]|uniref:DUF924 family protein n=1 Tax=Phaeovulum sp. NW3 TaxID=2934933 RepID=UPI0032E53182
MAANAPAHFQPIYRGPVAQGHKVRVVIATFGRHPHRNQILGRASTPAESAHSSPSSIDGRPVPLPHTGRPRLP